MLFSSFTFLFYFFPIFFILYFLIPSRFKNLFLFFSSLLFYAWGEPLYVLLMIFSTVNDFTFGKLIYANLSTDKKKARWYLICSIIANLFLLSFFKYSDFIIGILNSFGLQIPLLNLALPIGISFYTFQTMSYSMDIYRGLSKPQKNIIDFGTYVALFPQLIAGPIVTYNEIEKELTHRTCDLDQGMALFIIGLSKKILLANPIGAIWEQVLHASHSSLLGSWLGIICFGLQIYFDFSGYSDMAIGLGKMLGFTFPQNFNFPYLSTSITDFWRRWHISLSSWFKTYVYIPLGGNKKGLRRQILNILIVWFLTGLWHGANYNFILWGLYFGILLILEKAFLLSILNRLPKFFQHLYALFFILIGWVLFAIEDLAQMSAYLKSMFINDSLIDPESILLLYNNKVLILIAMICCVPLVENYIMKNRYRNVIFISLFIVCISFLISSSYNPFLYFRF